ncbi:MerR family DNA-binding protein [Streptomyces sp. NPDC056975]|uniref:MerR family DNA-binding protein n=1 Tax=unclassified Streptomyces TaxID=2593676 RepID=UPI00362BDFB7
MPSCDLSCNTAVPAPPETCRPRRRRTAQAPGFSRAEISRHGEELRDAPDATEAPSALLEEKIQLIDTRMAELATLRADLEVRVSTGYPLHATD